jgi:hypothetical protein
VSHNNNGLEDGRKYETTLRASRFPTIIETVFHNIILYCVSGTQSNNKYAVASTLLQETLYNVGMFCISRVRLSQISKVVSPSDPFNGV